MRKIIALAAAVAAVAVAAPSSAVADDVRGPACGDIVNGDGGYTSAAGVNVSIELAAYCSFMEYTLFVVTADGTVHEVPAGPVVGNQVFFSFPVADPAANPSVCVYATTSVGGAHHVFDRAPDAESDCQSIPRDGGGGFTGFS